MSSLGYDKLRSSLVAPGPIHVMLNITHSLNPTTQNEGLEPNNNNPTRERQILLWSFHMGSCVSFGKCLRGNSS